MLLTVALPLATTVLSAVCCATYQGLRADHYPSLDDLDLTFSYSTISFALSLLLVFKTNTSYSRFWEGACIACRLAVRLRSSRKS